MRWASSPRLRMLRWSAAVRQRVVINMSIRGAHPTPTLPFQGRESPAAPRNLVASDWLTRKPHAPSSPERGRNEVGVLSAIANVAMVRRREAARSNQYVNSRRAPHPDPPLSGEGVARRAAQPRCFGLDDAQAARAFLPRKGE